MASTPSTSVPSAIASAVELARARRRRQRRRRWPLAVVLGCVFLLAAGVFILRAHGYGYQPLAQASKSQLAAARAQGPSGLEPLAKLERENKRLATALVDLMPKGFYLVIDQTHNRLSLRKQDQEQLQAACSAGGGVVLIESGGGKRKWVFDTPRGRFSVLRKVENPVWKKPDWAFLEEGEPIPKNDSERFEYGMLGEYALHFGNGYMIHGTLYERLLGRSVTHGCIRLGRDDLRQVYASCPIGTPIFIY
jgi:hypothetical protein